MSSLPLLIVWFSGGLRFDDEKETKEAVAELDKEFKKSGLLTIINERWDTALKRLWDYEGDIIAMEHDVVPSMPMAIKILTCPEIWCSQRYRLYPATTGLKCEVWGERYHGERFLTSTIGLGDLRFIPTTNDDNLKYADAAPLGFTKMTHAFRKRIDPAFFDAKDYRPLQDLDDRISREAIKIGVCCHIHYPEMRHNHKTAINPSTW